MVSDPSRRPLRWLRTFRVQVALRICVLAAALAATLLSNAEPTLLVLFGAVALYQVISVIRYVDRTNRDLARFLSAIRYSDFSQTFATGGLGSSFDHLHESFNQVLDAFRGARAEKEQQARYLQTVVQHVGLGLIVFDNSGDVSLINTAAKRLLQIPRLGNIDDLVPTHPSLATLRQLGPGARDLVPIDIDGEVSQLALHAAVFRVGDVEHTLVSLYDIGQALDDKEMEAWQNLIRVLTHEIMNSITPISSLATTARGMLEDGNPDAETTDDIRTAITTIERRSEGLLHFVEAYRDLTRLPAPTFAVIPVHELFDRVQQLLRSQFEEAQVVLHTDIEPASLEITADLEQLEQVLINLLRNASQAASGRPDAQVRLQGRLMRGRTVLEVIDNGPGIVEEALDKIFIPFFTTKQDGSGIGLSLCRQIMRLHGGSIAVASEPDEQTVFTLRF